jgi:hypothetical protein
MENRLQKPLDLARDTIHVNYYQALVLPDLVVILDLSGRSDEQRLRGLEGDDLVIVSHLGL